jgi:hypothetical protein
MYPRIPLLKSKRREYKVGRRSIRNSEKANNVKSLSSSDSHERQNKDFVSIFLENSSISLHQCSFSLPFPLM